MLRYLNFEILTHRSLKLGSKLKYLDIDIYSCCKVVNMGTRNPPNPRRLGNYLICERFAVKTLLWPLKLIQN